LDEDYVNESEVTDLLIEAAHPEVALLMAGDFNTDFNTKL
jgi:hypothetical protein